MRARSGWLPCLFPLLAACGGGEAAPAPTQDVDSTAAAETAAAAAAEDSRWITVSALEIGTHSARPSEFRVTESDLRVILEAGPTLSPYRPGLLIANLLEGDLSLPLESVRLDVALLDTVLVDTTEVTAGPGRLYLFVAQQQGLEWWRVTVQERRSGEAGG